MMPTNTEKFELLKQITALDFIAIDLNLYLNTHPMDKKALALFNENMTRTIALKQKYERCYGMLSSAGCFSPYPWQWINEPWPWEYEANFKLSGEVR